MNDEATSPATSELVTLEQLHESARRLVAQIERFGSGFRAAPDFPSVRGDPAFDAIRLADSAIATATRALGVLEVVSPARFVSVKGAQA